MAAFAKRLGSETPHGNLIGTDRELFIVLILILLMFACGQTTILPALGPHQIVGGICVSQTSLWNEVLPERPLRMQAAFDLLELDAG